jgi:hypothetical protein
MKPQVYEMGKESKPWWTSMLDKFGKMKRYNISFKRCSKKIEEIPKRNHKTR